MGQTNSTNGARRTPSAPSNVLVSPAVAAVNHGQSEVRASPTSPDTGSRSRIQEHRRSLRNSVVGLMSPSSSTQNGEGDASRSGVESGKWWRRSRRWSKTPAVSRPDSVGGDAAAGLTQPILEDLPSSQAAREPAVTNASLPNYDIRSTSGDDSTPQSSVEEPPLDRANLISETTSHHGARSNTLISKGRETSSDVSATARLAQGDSKEGEQTNQPSASRQSSSLDSASPPCETEAAPTIDQVSEGRSGSIVNEVPSPASSQTETRPPQDNHPLRQFPPAGALVVVQGVVHTTDSARQTQGETGPAPQSGPPMLSPTTDADVSQQQHSRPSTGPQGNGLLANLLRRRNSTTSLGPRTSVDPGIVEGPVLHDSHELSGVEPGEVASTSALRRSVETTPSTVPIPGEGGARRSGQLSSSSVDVLGTLLSVATAATAASLLSSSGNQALSRPPQASIPSESAGLPPSNAAAGSAIPALARALASANPTAAAAIAQRDRERDREENERNRVRTLWESLRERLVHGRGGRELVPGSETAGFSRPGGLPMSASGREHGADGSVIPDSLFSELARAFNLGPSQEERLAESQNAHVTPSVGEANFSASTQPQDTRVRRDVEEPDSFGRFLVDLQVDLRIALTRMDSASNSPSRASDENRPNQATQSSEEAVGAAGTSTESDGWTRSDVVGESAPLLRTDGEVAESEQQEVLPIVPKVEETCDEEHSSSGLSSSSMPELVNFSSGSGSYSGTVLESDIETSSSHDSDVSRDGPGISIPNGSAPETVPSVPSSTDASRSGRNSFTNGQGINWWRMYRFPPMQIPQSRQQGAAMNGLSSGPTAAPADRPLNAQVAVETSTTNSTEASTSYTPPLREPSANLVVPVIVVGLQSINSNIHRTPPPAPGSTSRTEEVNGAHEAREARGHDTDNIASTAESQRGRPWPSRAARAFGRLGRRGTTNPATHDQDVQDTLGGGARTFFIYVFGGYYPPDHHILTGTDSLDSFETLWELAELLGQVKPPVVTEEEIERSGLQVFKANSLEEFERNEQVASNCVDRCLICLDDYKPEDDLRLLSCKHAFHKACVDQWLKTGRNNCPACRSKGVKTEEQNTSRASTM